MDPEEACKDLGISEHTLRFTSTVLLTHVGPTSEALNRIYELVLTELRDTDYKVVADESLMQISVSNSVLVKVGQSEEEDSAKEIIVSWSNRDEHVGSHLLSMLESIGK